MPFPAPSFVPGTRADFAMCAGITPMLWTSGMLLKLQGWAVTQVVMMMMMVFVILSTYPLQSVTSSHMASNHVAVDESSYLLSYFFNPAIAAVGILIIHINM